MVRITEEEFTDHDGRVRKVRKIEAAQARIEHPDGTVEEYSDIAAEEWPWSPESSQPEWRIFGIPILKFLEQGLRLNQATISFLAENGEIILKVGSLSIGIQASVSAPVPIMGSEIPLND